MDNTGDRLFIWLMSSLIFVVLALWLTHATSRRRHRRDLLILCCGVAAGRLVVIFISYFAGH